MSGPGVLWRGPLTDPSGYAAGGRAFVRGLAGLGADVRAEPQAWNPRTALSPDDRALLGGLIAAAPGRIDARVEHTFPPFADLASPAPLRVLRTMFETDRIPPAWVAPCNAADEVWVPTEHNRTAFADAGVDPGRLVVVPEPFELDRLRADVPPLELPGAHGTVFLAAFDFTLRKGWDALLAAWCAAFAPDDDVTLVLKVWSTTAGMGAPRIHAAIGEHVARLGHDPARIPDVVLVDDLLSPAAMSALLRAADVYVAPTRGEGWGRPVLEAMALGRPAIATAWSGPGEFVDASVGWPVGHRLVDVPPAAVAEVPAYAGHRWAEPDADELAAALQEAHRRPAERAARGAAAAARAERYDHRQVAAAALGRLGAPAAVAP
ncbi:glycosyltransferase family 4 protein [Miltoncostaea marina]|uniref:glycosyltransferase family 4 protein n=1 Tax=Miltoncostaea marina TaxID=2843215 RepID=UPI001C3CFB6D|nr:glycosyltransferase family 4 protein [Miltoncostaea marina]